MAILLYAEFIKTLAKSETFRKIYWTPLYVVKAIEYIHRRLLGRPTYGRQEMNQYFDILLEKRLLCFNRCSD
jgi:phycobilisome core-membrane linker protein